MAAKRIKGAEIRHAVSDCLEQYTEEVNEAIGDACEEALAELVRVTKATAPKKRGKFRRAITYEVKRTAIGSRGTWYVKAPHYRLTHLLVHGHATRDGGRTKADPFLQNALDQVLPEFERKVEEAIKSGK